MNPIVKSNQIEVPSSVLPFRNGFAGFPALCPFSCYGITTLHYWGLSILGVNMRTYTPYEKKCRTREAQGIRMVRNAFRELFREARIRNTVEFKTNPDNEKDFLKLYREACEEGVFI